MRREDCVKKRSAAARAGNGACKDEVKTAGILPPTGTTEDAVIRLFPREETFLPQFMRATEVIVEAAVALDKIAGDFTDVDVKVAKIKHLEHEGDQVAHRTFALLS